MNAPTELPHLVEPRPVPAAMLDALKARFGDRCTTALAVREQHGRDESPFDVRPPDAVVFCESTDDVAFVVGLAHQHAVPVIPYGTGSSLEGHLLAVQGGISIDLPRIDGSAGDARVDGATGDGGMCLAPASRCTQGATACCGDYSCGQEPGGTFCCHPAMGSCANSIECCGQMLCNIPSGQTRGTCTCRRRNEVCTGNTDCCGGAQCVRPDGGTSGTCACSREF